MSSSRIKGLKSSHSQFGILQPVVVNNRKGKGWRKNEMGMVSVGGEHRLRVAKSSGLKNYPCVIVSVGRRQEKVLNLALNNAEEPNVEALGKLLKELSKAGEKLAATGFDQAAIDLAIQEMEKEIAGQAAEDDAPPIPLKAVTKPGELIELGRHRLLCGDAGDLEAVKRLVGDQRIHLVSTDPPYNVKVEPRSNNAIASGIRSGKSNVGDMKRKKDGSLMNHQELDLARRPGARKKTTEKMRAKDYVLINDHVSDEEFQQKLTTWMRNFASVMLPGRCFYLWGGYHNCFSYSKPLAAVTDLFFSQAIIWHKMHPVLTRKDFMGDHEWCFYGWKLGASHFKNKAVRNCPDVWAVKKVNPQSMIHLTEKPVELSRRALTLSSRPGENVLDLFGGGGGTLIAAEETDRNAFLMELDPRYCDVIRERWKTFSQKG